MSANEAEEPKVENVEEKEENKQETIEQQTSEGDKQAEEDFDEIADKIINETEESAVHVNNEQEKTENCEEELEEAEEEDNEDDLECEQLRIDTENVLHAVTVEKYSKLGYLLKTQHLKILQASFEEQFLVCACDYEIESTVDNLKKIALNFSSCSIFGCLINGETKAEFSFVDPFINTVGSGQIFEEEMADAKLRDLFSETDIDLGHGELIVNLPDEFAELPSGSSLSMTVEFIVKIPSYAINFKSFTDSEEFYFFTKSWMGMNRYLMPCLDSQSYKCNWALSFVLPENCQIIAPGTLIDSSAANEDIADGTFIQTYKLPSPKSAQSIGFCFGTFEKKIFDEQLEIYYTKGLEGHINIIKKDFIRALNYIAEELKLNYPTLPLKVVFVDTVNMEPMTYDGICIFSVYHLYEINNIEATLDFHNICSRSLCQQIFGHALSKRYFYDFWLLRGLENHFTKLICMAFSGFNEYCFQFEQVHRTICDFEKNYGFMLPMVKPSVDGAYSFMTVPSEFRHYLDCKTEFMLKQIEDRITQKVLIELLNSKIDQSRITIPDSQLTMSNLNKACLGQFDFFRMIQQKCFIDLSTKFEFGLDNKISYSLSVEYMPNKKRNVIEILVTQPTSGYMINKFHGDVKLTVQEWDGVFIHDAKIDYPTTKIDLPFSSRGRRSKRRNIKQGSEKSIEIDNNLEEPESPILWLIVDPDFQYCFDVDIKQSISQWRWMLIYEQNPIHQSYIFNKVNYISDGTLLKPLFIFIQTFNSYYKLKMKAIAEMCNITEKNITQPEIIDMIVHFFNLMFFSKNELLKLPIEVNANNVSDFMIKKSFIKSFSQIKFNTPETCIFAFRQMFRILSMFNQSICCFDLSEIEGLTMIGLVNTFLNSKNVLPPEILKQNLGIIVHHLAFLINREKISPSYNFKVTSACMESIKMLVVSKNLAFDSTFFLSYSTLGNTSAVLNSSWSCMVSLMLYGVKNVQSHIFEVLEDGETPFEIKKLISQDLVKKLKNIGTSSGPSELIENLTFFSRNCMRNVSPEPLYRFMFGKELFDLISSK